jgi:hypothetical protein
VVILLGDLVVPVEQRPGLGDAVLDVAEHRLGLVQLRFLLQDAHRVTRHKPGLAVGRLLQASHHPQQGRLAGAVRADRADLGAGQEGQRHLVQDDLAVEGLPGMAESENLVHGARTLLARQGPLA